MATRPLMLSNLKKEILPLSEQIKPAPVQYLYCPRNPFINHEQYTTEIADIKKRRRESSVCQNTLFFVRTLVQDQK